MSYINTKIVLFILVNSSFIFTKTCETIANKAGLWYIDGGVTYACASSTRYSSTTMGACGCGDVNKTQLPWLAQIYSAGVGSSLFGNGTWCGSGCGKCYEATPTGYSPNGKGAQNIQKITIMATDRCNSDWCPTSDQLNKYGYSAHFNLFDENSIGKISALGWDNPELYYREVQCPANLQDYYGQCSCSANSTSSGTGGLNTITNSAVNISPNSTSLSSFSLKFSYTIILALFLSLL